MATKKKKADKGTGVDPNHPLVNIDHINDFRAIIHPDTMQEIAREQLSEFVMKNQVNGHTLQFLEEIVDECEAANIDDSNG